MSGDYRHICLIKYSELVVLALKVCHKKKIYILKYKMEIIWKSLIKDVHIVERGEIPRGGGDSPHDIKWIPEHEKGKWYEELLYFFSQEDEDKVIELTSKYYPTIWDEKKCIAYLCRECKIIIIDI